MSTGTTILYRPIGPKELELIAARGYREFLPRLPEQPIFYPVNRNIVGLIEVIAEYKAEAQS